MATTRVDYLQPNKNGSYDQIKFTTDGDLVGAYQYSKPTNPAAISSSDNMQTMIGKLDRWTDCLPVLMRGKVYAVGDIGLTRKLASNLCLECVTAGTTGTTEPSFSGVAVGTNVQDGTVSWVVRKIVSDTTYGVATTNANGLMSKQDKAILDAIPNNYATQAEVDQLATTATNSVSAAVSAKNDAVTAKNQAQSIADGLAAIRDTAVDTSLAISGQAADSKTVGDKLNVIGASQTTNNEYLCVWLDSSNRVLFGVKADGSFTWQKGIPKVLKEELDDIKVRLDALEG